MATAHPYVVRLLSAVTPTESVRVSEREGGRDDE